MTSDTSGSWGCGAWHHQAWFQIQWDQYSSPLSIPEKELIPILLGCAAWGAGWAGHQVICHSDNQVVVSCLKLHTSKHKGVMHLIRCPVLIEAKLGFYVYQHKYKGEPPS